VRSRWRGVDDTRDEWCGWQYQWKLPKDADWKYAWSVLEMERCKCGGDHDDMFETQHKIIRCARKDIDKTIKEMI